VLPELGGVTLRVDLRLSASIWACLLFGTSCYPQFDVDPAAYQHDPARPQATDGGGASSGASGTTAGERSEGGAEGAPRECARGATVLSGLVTNVRDLGGIPVETRALECGAIYRGGPLKALTAEGCERVAELGLATVIDLRQQSERDSVPTSDCVEARIVSAPLPIPYGLSGADYLADLNATASIQQVFHTFGDPAAYPIYFHCTYGRDRTGVVGALLLLALGVSRQDVMTDYLLSKESVGAYPAALNAVLDDIEQRGGATQVLHDLGIADAELEVLRSHVVAGEPQGSP
jgi:hypothetical protein